MNNVDLLTFHCDIDRSLLTESDAEVNPSFVPLRKDQIKGEDGLE